MYVPDRHFFLWFLYYFLTFSIHHRYYNICNIINLLYSTFITVRASCMYDINSYFPCTSLLFPCCLWCNFSESSLYKSRIYSTVKCISLGTILPWLTISKTWAGFTAIKHLHFYHMWLPRLSTMSKSSLYLIISFYNQFTTLPQVDSAIITDSIFKQHTYKHLTHDTAVIQTLKFPWLGNSYIDLWMMQHIIIKAK